jgi:ferredoxin
MECIYSGGAVRMNEFIAELAERNGLCESGFYHEPVGDIWKRYIIIEKKEPELLIAWNNSDYVWASKRLFDEPSDFIAGTEAVCGLFGIGTVTVHLPLQMEDTVKVQIKNACTGHLTVRVVFADGPVDMLNLRKQVLVHHPETLENAGRLLAGRQPHRYVLVKKGDDKKLLCVSSSCTVEDILRESGMEDGWTFFQTGGCCGALYGKDDIRRSFYGTGVSMIELLSDSICFVDTAERCFSYAFDNSCGKCTVCREGLYQLSAFLKKAVLGKGHADDLKWYGEIAEAVKNGSLCSFGKESTAFLLNTFSAYRQQYEEHVLSKRCKKNVCQAFTDYAVDGGLCTACGKCQAVCPEHAILGRAGIIHYINTFLCTKCGKCKTVCPEHAIRRIRAGRQIGPYWDTEYGYYRNSRKQPVESERYNERNEI